MDSIIIMIIIFKVKFVNLIQTVFNNLQLALNIKTLNLNLLDYFIIVAPPVIK